jgi:hypothetical protein
MMCYDAGVCCIAACMCVALPLLGYMCTNRAPWGRLVPFRVLSLVVNPPLVLELAEKLCQISLLASDLQMPRVHTGLVAGTFVAMLDTHVTIAYCCASHRHILELVYSTSLQVCYQSMCIKPALL